MKLIQRHIAGWRGSRYRDEKIYHSVFCPRNSLDDGTVNSRSWERGNHWSRRQIVSFAISNHGKREMDIRLFEIDFWKTCDIIW
jgi:hypothetical protein